MSYVVNMVSINVTCPRCHRCSKIEVSTSDLFCNGKELAKEMCAACDKETDKIMKEYDDGEE